MPSSIRPPLIASTPATVIASGPGWRKVAEVISVPSRISEVSRASAPSVTQASDGPGSPCGPAAGKNSSGMKWSERKKPSNPPSSAARAIVRSVSYAAPCCGSVKILSRTLPHLISRAGLECPVRDLRPDQDPGARSATGLRPGRRVPAGPAGAVRHAEEGAVELQERVVAAGVRLPEHLADW